MHPLDTKIPPPVLALGIAVGMWLLSRITPTLDLDFSIRLWTALFIALVGGIYSCAGAISFRMAKTTVNPLKPELASSLVQTGIYKLTRNPMYVGLLLVLCAWLVFLAAPLALLGPMAFMVYIHRFQIAPEQRALKLMFGDDYAKYCERVRPWF